MNHTISVMADEATKSRAIRIADLLILESTKNEDIVTVKCNNLADYYSLLQSFKQFNVPIHSVKHDLN